MSLNKHRFAGKFAGALALLVLSGLVSPLFAWYYFTASNGSRKAWVLNSSCNSGNSQISIYVDSDTPANRQNTLNTVTAYGKGIIQDWNEPFAGGSNSLISTTLDTSTSMDANSVVNYNSNPVAGRIWIVYDSTGDVFSTFGVDPDSGVLGIGLSYEMDGSNPQNICSGLILINAHFINSNYADPVRMYKYTTLHELGHALGFAHSVSAGNLGDTLHATTSGAAVMYPFASSTGPTVLANDDMAGARAVYGP